MIEIHQGSGIDMKEPHTSPCGTEYPIGKGCLPDLSGILI